MAAPHPEETHAAKLLDGKALADRVLGWVKTTTGELATRGMVPGIAVVIVGDDPASRVYVSSKGRTARECGFRSFEHALPETTSQAELLHRVAALNADPAVHGILVQLPVPKHIDPVSIIQAIDPGKDVDGFHALNVGRLGTGDLGSAFVPCTPAGCLILIESVHGPDLAGLHAVVIGRSNIVGKPMASLLLAANATVTVAHRATRDLPGLCVDPPIPRCIDDDVCICSPALSRGKRAPSARRSTAGRHSCGSTGSPLARR